MMPGRIATKHAAIKGTLVAVLIALAGVYWMSFSSDGPAPSHAHELANADGSPRYTNALVHETSPYLLQHAHNPVDWHPWGKRAFDLARQADKPIFLSVGYSTCYWCHVMERQCFEDPDIAALMNEHFICIKVDREQRPDVDDLYMTATQLMTGAGGWPMNVFLTPPGAQGPDDPGLEPIFAGTYFPPTPMHGRPSFPQVLTGVSRAWQDHRADVLSKAQRMADAVTQALKQQHAAGAMDQAWAQDTADQLMQSYDKTHGGFGQAPKFPQPTHVMFLLAWQEQTPLAQQRNAIHHTLDAMARGGLYDQVGGGFHRYSTDAQWLVPHFEKMLYDNGQLLSLYARAMTLADDTQRKQSRRVMRETADYVLREMTDASGAFWSAQDAEVNAREGENYVWTKSQIRDAIDDAALSAFALELYGLDQGANFTDPHAPDATPVNVLFLPTGLHALGAQAMAKRERINTLLKAARDQRDQPMTDDKVIVAWNGLMIAGLADASRALNEPRYAAAAAHAADAIIQHMTHPDGGLYRTLRQGQAGTPAFLDDYAMLVRGLLALHEAGVGEGKYLDQAKRYTDIAIERFADDQGGYYDTLEDQPDLFVRQKSLYDGAIPSGNSVMIHNLLDLYQATGDKAYQDRAVHDLRSFATPLAQMGTGMAHMQHALLRAMQVSEPKPVVDVAATRIGQNVEVTLTIAPSYHLNANPASKKHLIPTRLFMSREEVQLDVDYPQAESATFAFADEPIAVYQGTVVLNANVQGDAQDASLMLEYQACDDTRCLPPQQMRVPVTFE